MKRAICQLALCAAVAVVPGSALAADALVTELERRLASAGVESANDHLLSSQPDAALLSRFNRMTAACELHAVSLAIRLTRGIREKAVQGPGTYALYVCVKR